MITQTETTSLDTDVTDLAVLDLGVQDDGTAVLLAALAEDPAEATRRAEQVATGAAGVPDPARRMTVAGLVLAFLVPVAGLVISVACYRWSAQVGHRSTVPRTAVILSATTTLVSAALLLALRVLGTPAT
ncbi:MAG TPA: hypothetical protein VGC57_07235 [Cellulomonas sp.]